ncbi:hypothetical protein [Cupriavidus basilensis]|uniref:hypothetical protein n=1 Tax=Cupriavidus basilensis TaxID=68895 RepID=UPI0039F65663
MTWVKLPDGSSVPLSYYGDLIWDYSPYLPHAARPKADKEIRWAKTPSEWVESMKGAVSAFTFRKAPGGLQLDPGSIPKRVVTLNAFAKWCSAQRIKRFQDVRAFDLSRYLQKLRDDGVYNRTLALHVTILRKVYDLRAYLLDSFTDEAMAALRFSEVGPTWEPGANEDRRTELIPLAEAAKLFGAAQAHLAQADLLLALRDELDASWNSSQLSRKNWGEFVKRPRVVEAGFQSVHKYESALADLRAAAYIVLAITTGCRVHELGDARVGCIYSEVIDGQTYWWLKSTTRKIGDGPERWLAPAVAEVAASVLERYSAPLRKRVLVELASARDQLAHAASDTDRAQLAASILELERNSTRLFRKRPAIAVLDGGRRSQIVMQEGVMELARRGSPTLQRRPRAAVLRSG